MSNSRGFPVKGDVITSTKFAYGYYSGEEKMSKKLITVDGKTIKYSMRYLISEDERVAIAAETGKIPPKERIADLGAFDESRGTANFVVEDAKMDGGTHRDGCFSPRDDYPDGWHVTARRLNSDGSYDPEGEVIDFYMSGFFNCMVDAKDIAIVGKMTAMFV